MSQSSPRLNAFRTLLSASLLLLAACDIFQVPSANLPPTPPGSRPDSAPARAPNPPRVPPSASPGDTAPPDSPRRAGPVEFHMQFTDRGDFPASKDLHKTLVWPSHPAILTDTTVILYEWRPSDGKEKQANPRTGREWGPIIKSSLSEMMEAENFERHLSTMGAWLDVWVPREFSGIGCFDVERWESKTDPFHTPASEIARGKAAHPGKTYSDLLFEFVFRTTERARELRPNIRSWGWYGLGGVHAGQVVWKPGYIDDAVQQARRDSAKLARIEVPMPVLYFPEMLTEEPDRRLSFDRVMENYIAGFGADRLASRGYCYVNAQHIPGKRVNQLLTKAEFKECIDAGLRAGMHRFIVWAAIDSRASRDELQRWIDNVLAPVARESQR